METLGQFLKREREFRAITLEDLQRSSKINLGVLKKIESDRWDQLPEGTIVRGFLKSYAAHVGLNVDEILSRYHAVCPPDTTPKSLNPAQEDLPAIPFSLWKGLLVAAGVIALLIYLSSL